MNINEFSNYLRDELNKYSIDIDNDKVRQLFNYMKGLLEWNNKINLTAIKDEKEFIMKHYVDSMLVAQYIDSKTDNVIDIGTGGGFPGIPLKIYYPEKHFFLVDSINKKLKVIEELVEKEKIKNVDIIHSRAEDLGLDYNHREKYDVVVSRAVANLTTLVELLIPLAKINGKIICMKGPGLEEELLKANNAIGLLGGQVIKIDEYILGEETRKILIIKKTKNTPKSYPRKAGIPLKNPLY